MPYAQRYSAVLNPVVLLASLPAGFGLLNARTGNFEVPWLFAINPGHGLTFP